MTTNGYYSQDVHGPYEVHDIGTFGLEEGGTIRGCQLAVATFGKRNASNAILVPTSYSGDEQDHRTGLRRHGPCAGSREVLHHRRESDRQRSLVLAA
jgi:homoserine acetyltransferase